MRSITIAQRNSLDGDTLPGVGAPRMGDGLELYADTVCLKLATGSEVQALVRAQEGAKRKKCLLLHGNPGSLLDWAHLLPLLADAADVVTIDLPGFGRSPKAGGGDEALGLDRLAADTIAVADALSWREPFYLVGHSHGGGVAQLAAARYPERISGLTLVGTLGAPAHPSYRLLPLPGVETILRLFGATVRAGRFRTATRGLLWGVMRDIFHPEPVSLEMLDRELSLIGLRPEILVSMAQVTHGRPSEQLAGTASKIRCPTQFVHGEADALVPVACARSIHDLIVSGGGVARFEVLPRAGHMLPHYQARALADLILRELAALDGTRKERSP